MAWWTRADGERRHFGESAVAALRLGFARTRSDWSGVAIGRELACEVGLGLGFAIVAAAEMMGRDRAGGLAGVRLPTAVSATRSADSRAAAAEAGGAAAAAATGAGSYCSRAERAAAAAAPAPAGTGGAGPWRRFEADVKIQGRSAAVAAGFRALDKRSGGLSRVAWRAQRAGYDVSAHGSCSRRVATIPARRRQH